MAPPADSDCNEASDAADPSIYDVFIILASNGWVGTQELGRIEQTCQAARRSIDPKVWEVLCYNAWPITGTIKLTYLAALGGHRALMRYRQTGRPELPPIPTTYSTDEMQFLVDISFFGEPVLSVAIPFESDLASDGRVNFGWSEPFVLGKASCLANAVNSLLEGWTRPLFNPIGPLPNLPCQCGDSCKFEHLSAKALQLQLHLFRPDGFCLLTSKTSFYQDPKVRDLNIEPDPNRYKKIDNQKTAVPVHATDMAELPLRFRATERAAEIQRRCGTFTMRYQPIIDLIEPGYTFGGVTGFVLGSCLNPVLSNKTNVSLHNILEEIEGMSVKDLD